MWYVAMHGARDDPGIGMLQKKKNKKKTASWQQDGQGEQTTGYGVA
jgi:hypothetical protein